LGRIRDYVLLLSRSNNSARGYRCDDDGITCESDVTSHAENYKVLMLEVPHRRYDNINIMKMKTISYNMILPVIGAVEVPENATDGEIEEAIFEDARDATKYNSTWKTAEVTDIYDSQEGHLEYGD